MRNQKITRIIVKICVHLCESVVTAGHMLKVTKYWSKCGLEESTNLHQCPNAELKVLGNTNLLEIDGNECIISMNTKQIRDNS
jgi:hypothetical protein